MRYFFIRVVKRKNFYIALLTGCLLSILYVIYDVLPYCDPVYHHSVYDIWIGTYTGSIFAMTFYLLIPFLVSFPMADFYLSDRLSGYYDHIKIRRKEKKYLVNLYLSNFITGGIITSVPMLLNVYLCYLFVLDRPIDLIAEETHNVSLYGGEVLFPGLYYDHPLLHIFITIFLAFVIGGLIANIALAVSPWTRNVFIVWIFAFVFNYLYESVLTILIRDGYATYYITTYMHQVAEYGRMRLPVLVVLILVVLFGTMLAFFSGVKRNE